MKIKIERTGSILDGKQAWLLAPQFEGGKKNFERSRGDILNFERALGIFTLGINGTYNFKKIPLEVLLMPQKKIEEIFIEGIRLDLLVRKMPYTSRLLAYPEATSKQPRSIKALSPRTIFKLKCFLLRFRADVFGDELTEQGTASRPSASEFWEQKIPEERVSVRSGQGDWPLGLLSEWEEYKEYRCDDFYAGPGINYRKKVIDRATFESDQNMFNQLVRFNMKQEAMEDLSLLDLVDFPRFRRYRHWYFAQRSRGGYTSFGHLCVQLAVLSRYLAAAGRLRDPEDPNRKYAYLPDSKSKRSLWGSFYSMKAETQALGATSGKVVESYAVSGMEPLDLLNLGISAWTTEPRMRASHRRLSSTKHMVYLRKRAAMFFILAPFMPVRARNWREMRWGKNLWRNERGRWTIHFEGKELKVPMRKKENKVKVNVYHHELPLLASEWVDRWRLELSLWLDCDQSDIETVVPYVFPQRKNNLEDQARHWGMANYAGFRSAINSLVLDLRGHQFPPHQIRHIVATSLVKDATLAQADLAAGLLGDTLQTVIDEYFRPDTDKMRNSYFSTLVATALDPEPRAQEETDASDLEAADD